MQQLQAGQQQMRTSALQEQAAGMQLQKLQEDRANIAKLSQMLAKDGITPRQYFQAFQQSNDPEHQRLGVQGLMDLDATEKYDAISKRQQPIPAQQAPAPMAGGLGTGTFGLDNIPGMPNALASRAAPMASTNALAAPMAADPVAAIDSEIALYENLRDPRAKDKITRLQKQRDELTKRYTVGNTLMNQMGDVVGTAPAAAKTIGTVNPSDFTPASVANFNRSGNYGDLVSKPVDRVAKDDPKTTAAFSQVDNAGNVTFYNKFGESISTQKGAGKPSATFEKAKMQKTQLVKELDQAITELTEVTKDGGLIDQSTGSGVGRAVDVANRFVGRATAGDIAIGQLQPVADLALKMVPRFEGPQSNADTISYKQAAGQLADPTLPTAIRKEAGKTVLRLMKARKDQFTTVDMVTESTVEPAAATQGTGGFKYLGTEGKK
jgi:hypothetical protein